MSLINEALKRAQADKAREQAAPPPWTALSPPPAPPAPKRTMRLGTWLGLLAVAASAFWLVRKTLPDMFGVANAPAAVRIETVPAVAAPTAGKPAPIPAKPAMPNDTSASVADNSAIEELRSELARLTRKIELPATAQVPDPATRPATPSFALAPAETQPAETPAKAITQPKPAADAVPPPAKPNPPALKLSGIIFGPDGGIAIINGQSLRTGQEIGGARIVRIDQNEVHLEFEGTSISLRM